ncbi:MAG: site-specific DNA-methyltransferase [Anaerolineae bacterium]|nr:site-specific DNA-methyltransferase [Anaerolineae bacterium]
MTDDLHNQPVSKTTPDIVADQIAKLRALFPEAITEGEGGPQVDFDRLRATLGDLDALAGGDAYTFTWAGKQEAFRAIQTPSAASLQPVPEESVNWETTKHLFIEGENLEVLKLLYKSYVGKVKMIYIDPPYNTGNDFIYKDDYREPLRAYLEKTGQIDAEGNVLTSNPETRGRYHSDWLSMMYPRLFLARQLLRDDGVIFVSIDDNEVHHLRLLMNEVFGEENFIATVIWQKVYAPKNTAKYLSEDHDYVLVFVRNAEIWRPNLLPRTEEADARYGNLDNDPRGRWKPSDLTARNYYSQGQYEVTGPTGKTFKPGVGRYWRLSYSSFQELDQDNRIWWGEDGSNMPQQKRFLSEVLDGMVPQTLWHYADVGHTQEAKKEMLEFVKFVNTENVLNTLKPTRLLQRMLQIGTDPESDDIVLDFFSGSASMAHAVLSQNLADSGNRRFIMVQYPEDLPLLEPNLATIADIGRTRVRSVIERYRSVKVETRTEPEAQLALDLGAASDSGQTPSDQDLGFRAFRLAPSAFRHWTPPEGADPEALEQQLSLFDEGLKDDADPRHVLYEVILKEGYSLNSKIETLAVGENTVYRVTDEAEDPKGLPSMQGEIDGQTRPLGSGAGKVDGEIRRLGSGVSASFYVCLDDAIDDAVLQALPLDEETVFICQDAALDDSQKVNLSLQCVLKTI